MVPACAGAHAGGRDISGVAEFVEHEPHCRRAYTWKCALDVTGSEFGWRVTQDMLADAVLKCRAGLTTVPEVFRVTTIR